MLQRTSNDIEYIHTLVYCYSSHGYTFNIYGLKALDEKKQ